MTTLYVREPGAGLRRSGKRLIVYKGDETLQAVRLRDLERVTLLGNIDVSASVVATLLEQGVETVFLSTSGRFRGRLTPAEGKNVFVRQAQFRRYDDDEFRLRLATTLIDAKIRNARHLLQRYQRNHPDERLAEIIVQLDGSRDRAARQTGLASLLGVEGDAARVYFVGLGLMLRGDLAFNGRSRRPPRDPVNALLSFGYTLLTTELTGAVAAQGLDPFVGVLHDLDYGRPSLALDLLEEFRQPVIDRLVLSVVNRGALKTDHFEDRGEAGVLLNDAGRPRFLEFYHRLLETPFTERGEENATTYRAILMRQAERMRAALLGEAEYVAYAPR
jgi:CRISPR-associated protein Cas1